MIEYAHICKLTRAEDIQADPHWQLLEAWTTGPISLFEDIDTDTQALAMRLDEVTISYRKSELVVAFRNTEFEWRDFMTDLMFHQAVVPYEAMSSDSEIKVHAGFMCAYLSIRNELLGYIARQMDSVGVLTVTGHSLGGALATICVLDLKYNFPEFAKKFRVVTFGSPRVGNATFVRSYRKYIKETHRFVSKFDYITKVPITGYEHVIKAKPVDFWGHRLSGYIKNLGAD